MYDLNALKLLRHITRNTGHEAIITPEKAHDDTMAALKSVLAAGGGAMPKVTELYRLTLQNVHVGHASARFDFCWHHVVIVRCEMLRTSDEEATLVVDIDESGLTSVMMIDSQCLVSLTAVMRVVGKLENCVAYTLWPMLAERVNVECN